MLLSAEYVSMVTVSLGQKFNNCVGCFTKKDTCVSMH